MLLLTVTTLSQDVLGRLDSQILGHIMSVFVVLEQEFLLDNITNVTHSHRDIGETVIYVFYDKLYRCPPQYSLYT